MSKIEFISAGAGSGKTYRLTSTLSEALERGTARPEGILATTFTVKAATELRERARDWLLSTGKLNLATAIGQAKIGTVNSVCGMLLKRFCFELGLSPEQTVLSESQTKRLVDSTLADTLDEAGQSELAALTARLGIEADEWGKAIRGIVQAARDNDIEPAALVQMSARNADLMLANWPAPAVGTDPTLALQTCLDIAEREVAKAVDALVAAGSKVTDVMTKGLHELQRLNRSFRNGRWTWPDWIAACGINAGAPMRDVVRPVADAAQAHEVHPQFHSDVRRYLELAFRLAADALDRYAEMKRLIGGVDFSDQEILLLDLVRNNQEVRDALTAELDLVMVDEFQDTSPLQLALFVELAELAKRSVWVGDPKQAIYGFRGTDSSLIAGVLSSVQNGGIKLGEPLTVSRRSTPALVSLTNSVFVPAFSQELDEQAVRLHPSRADIDGQPSLYNWNFVSSRNETDYLALGPAIRELLQSRVKVEDKRTKQLRDVQAGDIAVLCKKNEQVELAVASLASWGIPASSPRAGLLGTPEVLFVLACLRRLLDRNDTVATAMVLTLADGSPVHEWLGDRFHFLDAAEGRDHEWKVAGENAHPLLARLEALRSGLDALTPSEALRLAKAESQAARIVNQWSDSPHEARLRLANIEALLELGKTYEAECVATRRPATVGGLVRWLGILAANGEDDRAVVADNAVSVMTHHGAKGLEWPVVVLTSLGSGARSALWEVRARTEGAFNPKDPLANRFIHFWLKTWGKRKAPQAAVNAEASAIGQTMAKDALAENRRLLYVSMTRARDAMALVSCIRKEPNRQWVAEVNACDALFGYSGDLELPGGRRLTRQTQEWSAADFASAPDKAEPTPISWFKAGAPSTAGALWRRPSDALGGTFSIAEVHQVGTRIAVPGNVSMADLGSALHLCLARAGVCGTAHASEIDLILRNWGVAGAIDRNAAKRQVESFLEWVRARWPDRPIHVEVPLEADRADGSRTRGRIDFLVDTNAGWVILDHKSNPGGADRDEVLVQSHGPQLMAYADALTRATRRPVVEQWLFLPVGARAIRLQLNETPSTT